ncbi:MAG: hypothetical protein ACQEXB_18405 [Bacillota bacterium]
MKIVLYRDDNAVVEIEEGLENVEVKGNTVSWQGGRWQGIKLPLLILDDSVTVGETVNEDMLSLDQKESFTFTNLEEENKMLRERLTFAEDAILFLMDRSG